MVRFLDWLNAFILGSIVGVVGGLLYTKAYFACFSLPFKGIGF